MQMLSPAIRRAMSLHLWISKSGDLSTSVGVLLYVILPADFCPDGLDTRPFCAAAFSNTVIAEQICAVLVSCMGVTVLFKLWDWG